MNTKALEAFRSQQIAVAHVGHSGCCDLCGKKTMLEYHEIFPRSLTQGNDEARMISYRRELCALLCRVCHERAQYDRDISRSLLAYNMKRYGRESVLKAQAMLLEAMVSHVANIASEEPNEYFSVDVDPNFIWRERFGQED